MTRVRQFKGFVVATVILLIVGHSTLANPPSNSDMPAMSLNEILDKVTAAYKSTETYKSDGTITSDIDTGGLKISIVTSFSILLKKPDLYLISWTQKNMPMAGMDRSGAVWSDGTQPFLFMGVVNAYSKMSSDEIALGGATGISGGAAFTIPSLFLSVFKEQPKLLSRLTNPKVEVGEKVGEEECYVISGSSSISKKETFWVSKTSYLIKKYYRSLESPEGGVTIPEMTDEQLDEAIKGMGQKVTDETRQKMKDMMKKSSDVLKTAKLKGSSTEIHVNVSSPDVSAKDFQFTPPKDSVLKDSLFGNVLQGDK